MPVPGTSALRVVALAAASATALAQPRREQLTFPVTTRQVQVSVVVHKNGAPVPGLSAGDFELFEDGKPQAIESFAVESDRAPAAAQQLPAGAFTNRAAGSAGSVNVILLDRLNTDWASQGLARDGVVKFLGQIQPEDRVALYLLDSTMVRVLHDFTRDTASLLRALARYRGQTSKEQSASEEERAVETDDAEMNAFLAESARIQTAVAYERRAEATTAALEAIANRLAAVPGRKNLIWVSSGFPFMIDAAVGRGSRADLSQRSFTDEVNRATRAVNNANIAIYPVDARGLVGAFTSSPAAMPSSANPGRAMLGLFTTLQTTSPALDTMHTIADNTGGRVFHSSNDIPGAIRRAAEDARLSYVLGYSPSHATWDGRFRELKVRVKRPGVEVRHRKGYLALPLPQQSAARTARALSDALRNPLEATGIALVASARPTGRDQREVNLAVQVEARSVTLEKKGDDWTGGFAMVIAQSSSDGKVFKSVDSNVELKLTDELRERMLQQGLTVDKNVVLREDAHRIHVLVRDLPTGRTGSLIIPADKLRDSAKR